MFTQKNRIIDSDKRFDILLSLLVVLTAVFSHLPVWHFKYLYMLCAGCLSVIACIKIVLDGSLKDWIKANWIFILLATYMLVITTCKKLGQLLTGSMDSIITGYGESVYALFALTFFGAFSRKKSYLFMTAYVAAFAAIFATTGRYTLYDVGGVCRTISLYENPNILSVYAIAALCFSIILALKTPKYLMRCIYAVCGALAVAAAFHSSSRAMYLGGISAVALLAVILLYSGITGKLKFSFNTKYLPCIAVFVAAVALFIFIYKPLPANALINASGEELPQTTDPTTQVTIDPTESALSGIDRFMSDDKLTDAASIKGNIRLVIWKSYLEKVSLDTFWGSAPGVGAMYFREYGRDYAPHNILIYMLFVYGVPGLLLFVLLLLLHFVKVFFSKKPFSAFYCVLVSCVFALMVYGILHNLTDIAIFWCCIGLLNYYRIFLDEKELNDFNCA